MDRRMEKRTTLAGLAPALRDPGHDVNVTVNGGNVNISFISGNNVGESLSNSLDVCQPVSACKAKRNHEQDSAGPSTKRTRLGQEVCGYIHNVSQLRPVSCDSNRKSFTATLQRQDDTVTVTVFDQKRHKDFIDAQTEKQPVILSDVCFGKATLQTSLTFTFNENSQLGHMLEPGFQYDCKISEPKTVTSVLKSESRTTELITIRGRIREEQLNCFKEVEKKQIRMIKYILTDNKTDMVLTVWGDEWDISLGPWYTFSHIRVKEYMGKRELTITKYTEIAA